MCASELLEPLEDVAKEDPNMLSFIYFYYETRGFLSISDIPGHQTSSVFVSVFTVGEVVYL